ncbi:type VI secretion system membrane subunit TssM [Acinetobacter lanii]|uniref:Type VI secretion system membrane subunit TssM n=1 Tax=Acinetobacter lanii TaxID=2715163 RepID=A0A6G8S066_9GAMM|nr:type VI secretion system membrane subunit TssM [Acinetobacter lanii]QIO07596.1 type VI secretion system membrane subunit TssM [Acinetobacter lanii]
MYIILGYLWQYVTNPKAIIALSLFVALVSAYSTIPKQYFWPLAAAYVLGLIGYGIYWLIQRKRHAQQGEELAEAIEKDTQAEYGKQKDKDELQLVNQQMKESIQLIRKSKLGDKKGNAALYELPWYMVIGNPAAGKSSAIYNSGLKFPFEETHQTAVSSGLSGTRNCDWFFSTEGVLLDTAGRYSVYSEDHSEWIGFLNLLKKNRSKAPINGLIVTVSIAELVSQSPEKSLKLAKNLRARIQDLTERLEIFAPVYLVFSKMDLIAGFTEFFDCYDQDEFDQVWGATLPYDPDSSNNAVELFEQHYNILYDGLKSVSTTHLSRRHAQNISPSVMTFPLEFKTLKPALKTFIGTLFEENPYQFKPVFRGFYFTSALQEGTIESPMTEQIAQEFRLTKIPNSEHGIPKNSVSQNHGYFLKGLFSDVILKDKNLVKQHINTAKKRQRYLSFIAALLGVSVILGLWVWSYRNNQQLIADVQADLNKVVQMEQASGQQLSTQLDSLLVLQQRLQQLDDFNEHRPLKFGFGLYQGNQLREKLKTEYLQGVKQIVLEPSQQNMAQYLQRVKANEATLRSNHVNVEIAQAAARPQQNLTEPSETNPQDAYNALKAYLMMSNPKYMEAGHLSDQVTRFWRSWLDSNRGQMPRGEMIQKAEQVLSYSMTLANDQKFPVLNSDSQLVDQSRQVLLSVMKGMAARDRVYNEIKMRGAVRFPALTTAQIVGEANRSVVLGSYALPGIFTEKAWSEYVEKAIDTAANSPTETRDWVLNANQSDDLTFSGSPDQIRKQLTDLYKKEYIAEWRKFLGSIYYAKNNAFAQQRKSIDLLGEPQNSPIRILMERTAKETSWDNPVVQAELAAPKTGFVAWFKRKVLRQDADNAAERAATQAQGPISKEFNVFYQLVRKRDDQQNKSLLDEYLDSLAQVRSKFNDLNNAGDVGPNAMALVKQTINEQTSVFNTTQKLVDEKLSVGLNEADNKMVQKMLISPLTQAFESLIIPTQDEINKLWTMQAYQPFTQTLAQKVPFNTSASIQATSAEIGQIFGEGGSIASFVKETLDPFVIRRGYTLTSKTWKDQGIILNPQFVMNFQRYVTPLNGTATGNLAGGAAPVPAANQSNFQFYPLPNPQLLSYTIDIDGQRLVFENGIQQWVNFVWPNAGAIPGARITAVDLEGKTHTIFDAPGEYGINRLIDSSQRREQNGVVEMTWASAQQPSVAVKVNFRLISGNSGQGGNPSVGSNRDLNGVQLVDKVTTNKATVRVVSAQQAPASAAVANPATANALQQASRGATP